MPASSLAILAGPTFSGKTGCLARWAAGRGDVVGLLSPDGPEGRSFVDLASGERIAMEAKANEADIVEVGRFRFRAAAFEWANERLIAAARNPAQPTLIVDEVGPIELRGEGLRPGLEAALRREGGRLVLVVRETLVEEVRRAFSLTQAELFSVATWPPKMSAP